MKSVDLDAATNLPIREVSFIPIKDSRQSAGRAAADYAMATVTSGLVAAVMELNSH